MSKHKDFPRVWGERVVYEAHFRYSFGCANNWAWYGGPLCEFPNCEIPSREMQMQALVVPDDHLTGAQPDKSTRALSYLAIIGWKDFDSFTLLDTQWIAVDD